MVIIHTKCYLGNNRYNRYQNLRAIRIDGSFLCLEYTIRKQIDLGVNVDCYEQNKTAGLFPADSF